VWAHGEGSPASFLSQTNAGTSKDGRTVTVPLRKSPGGRAASWREARVRGSVSITKSSRGLPYIGIFLLTTREGCGL
jgi:hypothetical protein